MTDSSRAANLLAQLEHLNEQQLRRLLVEHLTKQKLGLYWEASAIERDAALNADLVLPRLVEEWSHYPAVRPEPFDSVRPELVKGTSGAQDRPVEGGVAGGGSTSSPRTESQFTHRNLIIEGDNYDSLRLLRATHAGKIRVIYIDPPYNTGNKDWVYNDHYVGANDRWRHSQWLEFLYRRLALARDLLTPEGVILVSINDENRARLELLMDEVFPGMGIGSFVWRTRKGSNDAKSGLLSVDHEHVLVYANPGFEFAGSGRDETKYDNPDNDPRGSWGNQMLIKSHNAKERPEAYYTIRNPESDVWYLCEPDSVWRFSSTSRPLNKKKLQADPIEIIIEDKRILWPANEDVVVYNNRDELWSAIKAGTAPKELRIYLQLEELKKLAEQDVKVARLITYIEPLEHWVGKKLGYGRPRYKRFRESLKRETNPLSSWILSASEPDMDDEDFDDVSTLVTGGTSEGTALVRKLLENKDFAYPKPLSLIKGLLAQATLPNDIVLDFFGGSGTTGQAVLELNAEDGGQRRFILCSSTEANSKEPDKNLCRDVCAERMRRVISGYGGKAGYTLAQGGEFAYLQLDKVEAADAHFEIDAAHAFQLLALKRLGVVCAASEGAVQRIGRVEDCELLVCNEVNADTIATLAAWPQQYGAARLAIYSTRPKTLAEQLAARGVEANCYSLMDALLSGQRGSAT